MRRDMTTSVSFPRAVLHRRGPVGRPRADTASPPDRQNSGQPKQDSRQREPVIARPGIRVDAPAAADAGDS